MSLISWLKRNFHDTPKRTLDERVEKTAEIYLHDDWLEMFDSELERWAETQGGPGRER